LVNNFSVASRLAEGKLIIIEWFSGCDIAVKRIQLSMANDLMSRAILFSLSDNALSVSTSSTNNMDFKKLKLLCLVN
jgi:hypothetical protein